jgi:hypothetical protein
MKILKVLYYYYFVFYKKWDDEPHATTLWSLSFMEALLINGVVQMFCNRLFCYFISTIPSILLFVAIIVVNYFLYIKSGLSRKIINAKPPPILYNVTFTKAFVILFVVACMSCLFWVPILTKSILDNCNWGFFNYSPSFVINILD